jgi:hypothetical protein
MPIGTSEAVLRVHDHPSSHLLWLLLFPALERSRLDNRQILGRFCVAADAGLARFFQRRAGTATGMILQRVEDEPASIGSC